MQLYVKNRSGKKIVLDVTAPTRRQLASKIGHNFFVANEYYNISQVKAESNSNDTASGAVIGGLVGLVGGFVGVAVGGFVGGLIGNSSDSDEARNVQRFNQSY